MRVVLQAHQRDRRLRRRSRPVVVSGTGGGCSHHPCRQDAGGAGPRSRLGGEKVWSRRDLVVVAVTAAREQVYAPTRALAVEQAIADTIERLAAARSHSVDGALVEDATATKECQLGRSLTRGQARAVEEIAAGDTRVQFVVGVAGAGKTTALDAATTALTNAGWTVLGTSTSGQAARTLGEEAAIASRTVASLLWRLEHGQARLDANTVVVVDEAAMTTDEDLLRLTTAIETTGARLVLVGDPSQLGAVGPGGAMAALMTRHPELVTHLDENVRQLDPAERTAIADLRAGRIDEALTWYRTHDRIRHTPTLDDTLESMVDAWNHDIETGRSTTMLVWRRDHVAELNTLGRAVAIDAGRVHGPALDLGDGFEIAAGDQLIALAPNRRAGLVTSQRLTVTAVDPDRHALTAITGGRTVHLSAAEAGPGQLDYGYATTIHRAQGATFDASNATSSTPSSRRSTRRSGGCQPPRSTTANAHAPPRPTSPARTRPGRPPCRNRSLGRHPRWPSRSASQRRRHRPPPRPPPRRQRLAAPPGTSSGTAGSQPARDVDQQRPPGLAPTRPAHRPRADRPDRCHGPGPGENAHSSRPARARPDTRQTSRRPGTPARTDPHSRHRAGPAPSPPTARPRARPRPRPLI